MADQELTVRGVTLTMALRERWEWQVMGALLVQIYLDRREMKDFLDLKESEGLMALVPQGSRVGCFSGHLKVCDCLAAIRL